jgi:hypothetical protein
MVLMIAVCDDEQKNVAIAAAVGQLVTRKGQPAGVFNTDSGTECLLFVADPRLRQTFRTAGLFPRNGSQYRVNVKGIDWFDLAARLVLAKAPLDWERIGEHDPTVAHLVIVGLGAMGRHLAVHAARIGHFANFHKLRITVIDERNSTRPAEFLARYPKFPDVCEYAFVPIDLTSGGYPDAQTVLQVLPKAANVKELLTVAVCWDSAKNPGADASEMLNGLERDDPTNLNIALALSRAPGGRQALVFLTRKLGLGALFPNEGRGMAIGPRVHAFGMLEETWSRNTLLDEEQDRIARAFHEDYRERSKGSASSVAWDDLDEDLKDSNRRAADHIPVKMRALGYRVDKFQEGRVAIESFTDDEKLLLARMEHESWMAELLLQGYSFAPGPRDRQKKTHGSLQPWTGLDEPTRKKDIDQVETIPGALKGKDGKGFRIYSQI